VKPPRLRQAGFTLLELIVVIGIFALMAAMAYGGLSVVLHTRTRVETALADTAALQKAYWIMRDDFQNAVPRSVLDNDNQRRYALQYTGIDRRVSLTRAGWPNPLDLPRSTLRRLSYFYDDGKRRLVRRTWPVLDRAPRTAPVDTTVLEHVQSMRWRFLDGNGRWQEQWPTASVLQTVAGAVSPTTGSQPPPPRAVELTLEVKHWGRLRWLFTVGLPQLPGNGSSGSGLPGSPGASGPAAAQSTGSAATRGGLGGVIP